MRLGDLRLSLRDLQRNWDALGRRDPRWAVLTDPARTGGRWDEDAFARTGAEDARRTMARLAQFGLPADRRRALDFGCGAGRVTLPLAKYFDEIVGVDIAPAMLDAARARDLEKRCRFVLNAEPDLSLFGDATFDLVHSRLVLQHIPPQYARRYIAEFVRITRPGGAVLFQVPTPSVYRPPCGPLAGRVPPLAVKLIRKAKRMYRHLFRPATAEPVMDDYGLGQDEVKHIIDTAGARIVDVAADESHGSDYRQGFEYLVTRP